MSSTWIKRWPGSYFYRGWYANHLDGAWILWHPTETLENGEAFGTLTAAKDYVREREAAAEEGALR